MDTYLVDLESRAGETPEDHKLLYHTLQILSNLDELISELKQTNC